MAPPTRYSPPSIAFDPRAYPKKKQPPEAPTAGPIAGAPAPVGSISAEADRIIAEMLSEIGLARDAARREAERASQTEANNAKALAEALSALGMPGLVQGAYSNAAGSIGALGQGFSGAFRDQASAQAAEMANLLGGNMQGVRNEGEAMGDVTYGLGGFLPARGLEQTGAAFASQAALQPGFALREGQERASQVMSDFASDVLPDFMQKEAEIRTRRPSIEAELRDKRKAEMFQLYEAGFVTQRELARSLGLKNWRTFPNTLPGEGPSKINASNSKLVGYLVDDYGNPIRDRKGKVIPIREDVDPNVRMWQDSNGVQWLLDLNTGNVTQLPGAAKAPEPIIRGGPSEGFTIFDENGNVVGQIPGTSATAEVTPKMRGQARRMARQAFYGIPKGPARDIFGNPVPGQREWKQRPMGYQEAFDLLVSEGIPPELATKALNSFYKPGKGGRPPKGEPPSGGDLTARATSAGFTAQSDVVSSIVAASRKYGVDPLAVMAVALAEGGLVWGAVGDGGTSYGPFQLHVGGALPKGKSAAWANSPAGIEYAIRKMAAAGARGLQGQAAIDAIVRRFERPADPDSEIERARGYHSRLNPASWDRSSMVATGTGWQGTLAMADSYKGIASKFGLQVTSEKRTTKNTASGGRSDHWVGSKDSYAYDLSGPVANMDAAARALMASFGINWTGGPIVKNFYRNGYRIQILYRTNVGGDHYDHLHLGVRKGG